MTCRLTTERASHSAVSLQLATSLAGALALVVGSLVLTGWALDLTALKSVLPGWVSVKPNTALAFVLMGVALLLSSLPHSTLNSTFPSRLVRLCALLTGSIGLLSLGEYVSGASFGIDQWLFSEPTGTPGTSYPGRMAPEAALCFALLAAAFWITSGSRKTRWTWLASAICGLLVTTLALAAMLCYFTPNLGAYGWWGLTIMAVPTAATFAVLGLAVISIAWQQGVSSWSLSKKTTMAFAWGLALLVFIGLNTSRSQFRMRETADQLAHSEKIRGGIASILADVANAQTHTRGYVITGDERFLDSYLSARARCNGEVDGLRQLIADSPRQQTQLARLEVQVKVAIQWFQQVIDASRTGMTDAARRKMVGHGEDLMDNVRATFQQIEREDRQFFEQLKQESESVAQLSYLVISIGTLASLVIFLTVLFGLDRAVGERQRTQEEIHRLNADLEQRVIQRTAELEAANKELEAFSYSVSHDLRAPLRAVDGFSQAVLDDYGPQLPDEGRRYLQTIRESAQRMGALIDDLLTFSRLGRQPLNKQTVDTGKLVNNVLEELSFQRQGRQVEVRVGDLPSCEGDPALLKQVWVNLLSNALKYTRRRAPAVVEIGCDGDNGAPVYFVRDNGTGFDMQYANKLFGVFQRLHRAEEFEGTGVGLAIVQRVLHRHGGRVWAEAAEDRGATFYFTLGGGTKG